MKEVSLLVYEDAVLSSVSGVLDLFAGANQLLQEAGRPPAFKIELVSEKLKNIQLAVPAQFMCYKTLDEVRRTDLILVPAFTTNISPEQVLRKNGALVEWIKEMFPAGAEVASMCVGSFFLGAAGLLNGRACTSHWMYQGEMQRMFPRAQLLSDMVVTDQEGIYTSGGAFSSLNLILYLIEKFCGREIGVRISKIFSIDMDRVNQAHFAVFQGQHRHEDEEILRAQAYIEQNYHLPITIEQIAEHTNMSKRNFIRRFKNATQNTPLEYLQRVKIESAKKALEKSPQNISSLMYNVGYNDVKTFRKVFKRITGLSPQEYRRKYSRASPELN